MRAVTDAYAEIGQHADTYPGAAADPADAICRIEALLRDGSRQVSMQLQSNVTGPWGDQLLSLRQTALNLAGQVLAALRTAISNGAAGHTMPNSRRLEEMASGFQQSEFGATRVEMLGDHEDQTLVEQFTGPLMLDATALPGATRLQAELVRACFATINRAAQLIAAIDNRPALHRDWD